MLKFTLRTLDDTSWALYDIIGPIGTGTNQFTLDFTSNNTQYSHIRFEGTAGGGTLYFDNTLITRYPECVWSNDAYKTLDIAGGTDATNPSLLAWFQQYGKNTTPNRGDTDIVGALHNIATAISDSSEMPDPSEASVGDVLTKGEDGIGWGTPSGGVPAMAAGDAGKALMVNNSGTSAEWENPYFEQSESILFDNTATFQSYGPMSVAALTTLVLEHSDVVIQFDSGNSIPVLWNEDQWQWLSADNSVMMTDDEGYIVIGTTLVEAGDHSVKIMGESKTVRTEFVSATEKSLPALIITQTGANVYSWNGSNEEYARYVNLLAKSVPVTVFIKCLNGAIYSAPLQLAYGDVGSDTYLLAVVTSLKQTAAGGSAFSVSIVHDSYTISSDGTVITWTDIAPALTP